MRVQTVAERLPPPPHEQLTDRRVPSPLTIPAACVPTHARRLRHPYQLIGRRRALAPLVSLPTPFGRHSVCGQDRVHRVSGDPW